MADRKLSATITIGGSVDSSLGKAFGSVTKGAKGVGAELKAISQQTKELEKMVKELKAAGKSTTDLEKRLASLYRAQALTRAKQGRLQAVGGMFSKAEGLQFGAGTSFFLRRMVESERFGEATVKTLQAAEVAVPILGAVASGVAAIGAAAVVGAAAMFKLGTSVASFIDDTSDIADGLGVSANNLLGLQYAAHQSGIEADKLNEKLGKMTLSLETAKDGTGPTADALKELGLTYQELSVMNPESQLLSLAEALKKYKGNVPRVSLVTAFFGKNSARFGNMLNQGRDGIKGMMNDAREVGLKFTDDQVRLAAQFDSAWAKTVGSFKGLWLEIGTMVLPTVNKMLDDLVKWFKDPSTKAAFASVGKDAAMAFGEFAKSLPTILEAVTHLAEGLNWVVRRLQDIAALGRAIGNFFGDMVYDPKKGINYYTPGKNPVQPVLPDLPLPTPSTAEPKSLFRRSVPATPEVIRNATPAPQDASGKGFMRSSSSSSQTPAPAAAPVYNFTVNGATGQNTQELLEEIRRYLRDTQPHHVGAY